MMKKNVGKAFAVALVLLAVVTLAGCSNPFSLTGGIESGVYTTPGKSFTDSDYGAITFNTDTMEYAAMYADGTVVANKSFTVVFGIVYFDDGKTGTIYDMGATVEVDGVKYEKI